ncbi:MAG: GDSL-type esterase/lipase family protein [Vampirovibrionales bacterium]|nr:GDSL-type esterase/lipase family protein [Vampirovibrionales bacterium]
MAPAILCYGDSNTWGYIPGSGERLPSKLRWPGVLKTALGDTVEVLENGVNGRTVNTPDAQKPWRNGLTTLAATFQAHKPLDWVIVMLGINDLKPAYKNNVSGVIEHFRSLLTQILKSDCGPKIKGNAQAPKVLVVAPADLNLDG